MQAEAAVVIVAQTIPVIRVLLQPHGSSTSSNSRGASSLRGADTKAAPRPGEGNQAGIAESKTQSIALVQLPSGKIVRSDSEEGRALQNQGATAHEAIPTTGEPSENPSVGAQERDATAARERSDAADLDDEVHRIWREMGLSRRAWSKSPSPSPGGPSGPRG